MSKSVIIDLSLNNQSVEKNFIFKDTKVDFIVDETTNDIQHNLDLEAINGGIYNMFLFKNGENILEPEFGNSLYKYLYEGVKDLTTALLEDEIRTMFKRWEPRVTLGYINVVPDHDRNQYNIEVVYSVPALNQYNLKFNYAVKARRQ